MAREQSRFGAFLLLLGLALLGISGYLSTTQGPVALWALAPGTVISTLRPSTHTSVPVARRNMHPGAFHNVEHRTAPGASEALAAAAGIYLLITFSRMDEGDSQSHYGRLGFKRAGGLQSKSLRPSWVQEGRGVIVPRCAHGSVGRRQLVLLCHNLSSALVHCTREVSNTMMQSTEQHRIFSGEFPNLMHPQAATLF